MIGLENRPSKKAILFCVILVLAASMIFFALGKWQMSNYSKLKYGCTSEVRGTVVNVGRGHIDYSAESKNLSGKYWKYIEVETDDIFRLRHIYATRRSSKRGDEIIIHYDPKAPDNYYIGDEVEDKRSSVVFAYAASGLMIVFAAFIIIIAMRPKKQTAKQTIYFDTPYCRFLFVDSQDIGYEGEIGWNSNLTGEKSITAFFETDTSAAAPREGYYGLIEKRLVDKRVVDFDINKLILQIPQLREIQPGKCYSRLEKILSDKERIDHDVKKLVADYFWFRPELMKENASEQEIVDDIELSYIGICRNGDTEFDLYSAHNIYVHDMRFIIKADGSKEIHYRTDEHIGSDDECCVVL